MKHYYWTIWAAGMLTAGMLAAGTFTAAVGCRTPLDPTPGTGAADPVREDRNGISETTQGETPAREIPARETILEEP